MNARWTQCISKHVFVCFRNVVMTSESKCTTFSVVKDLTVNI